MRPTVSIFGQMFSSNRPHHYSSRIHANLVNARGKCKFDAVNTAIKRVTRYPEVVGVTEFYWWNGKWGESAPWWRILGGFSDFCWMICWARIRSGLFHVSGKSREMSFKSKNSSPRWAPNCHVIKIGVASVKKFSRDFPAPLGRNV